MRTSSVLCFAAGVAGASLGERRLSARQAGPLFPTEPGTSSSCNSWWDNEGFLPCDSILTIFNLSIGDFVKWNPTITAECGNFNTGFSYCVGVSSEGPGPVVTSTTTAAVAITSTSAGVTTTPPTTVRTTTVKPTTTAAGNGIATPEPIQDGMVSNCEKFHLVKTTTTCASITDYFGISFANLLQWNPAIGKNCENLWSGTYACVGVVGGGTPAAPTTTKPSNGIATPEPIQEGMVSNCEKFHLVKTTTTCASIMDYFGISWADLFKWNPAIGKNCESLWSGTYACVGVVGGGTPSVPTTTKPSNGISTPEPIQQGMTKSCTKFHLVKSTTTCASILDYFSLSWADFYSWNPAVGKDCQSLWTGTYACVATTGNGGATPTTPPTGNGVATPTPIQAGMTGKCNKFHLVKSTTTCASILNYYSLSWADFYSWNPAVGKDCQSLWTDTYACVAVIGGDSTPTTPPTGNGVATPTPIQAGMTGKCNKFHLVKTTTTCDSILNYYSLTWNNFFSWNPAVGKDCTSLWANTYACVGVL